MPDTDEHLLGSTPVDVGAALFSLHDPHPGYERAFNRYYERDHMYSAALLAPFTIAGQRWVATRDLKALRYPEPGPFQSLTAGSYLTVFWIQAGHLAHQQDWVNEQMKSLVAAGRTFEHRDVQTATAYDYIGCTRRDPDGVPPFMALDHRFASCVWMMFERDSAVPAGEFATWLLDECLSSWFAASPVALAMGFTPRPKEPWWPAAAPEVEGVGHRVVVSAFVDTDVRDEWDEWFKPLGAHVDGSGRGRTLLVAPFIPTHPGTDDYTDELR